MKKILIGLAVILALVLLAGLWVLLRLNAFNSVEPVVAGECRQIEGVPGVEDLTIDPHTGIAYLSSLDRRAGDKAGAIFGYDLTVPESRPVNLTPLVDEEFQPHGIGLWAVEGGPGRLMVINHPVRGGQTQHEVIVFEALGMALRQVLVVADPDPANPQFLKNPNDLVPIGPGTFYATNDHAGQSNNDKLIEDLFGQGRASVVYYDGADFSVAADGLTFPNGLNASEDGSRVYVASTMDDAVYVYERDADTGALTKAETISLDGGADNIERLPDGSLLVGIHANLLSLFQHASDPEALSPGKIVRISWTEDGAQVDTLHASDGSDLSGMSVAARYGNRLLIGSIFAPYILDCTLPD